MKTLMATNIRGGCGKTTNVLHTAIAATLMGEPLLVFIFDLELSFE
jgi:cellulose biosynthesis protein BcsQ